MEEYLFGGGGSSTVHVDVFPVLVGRSHSLSVECWFKELPTVHGGTCRYYILFILITFSSLLRIAQGLIYDSLSVGRCLFFLLPLPQKINTVSKPVSFFMQGVMRQKKGLDWVHMRFRWPSFGLG